MVKNEYDKHDMVKREGVILAGGLKIAAYRVRDPETNEWSPLQFHMTHDNTIIAMMGEEAAKLFRRFIDGHLPQDTAQRKELENV